jgi:glucose-1-phosphate thymidylyltransferase
MIVLLHDRGTMEPNTAVVLAAGEGQRLRPLTKNRPKPMLPAANRPILEYVLDALVEAGLHDVHLVVGYRRDRVQEHFGSSYREASITYHVQGKQLGSGHALLQAESAVDSDFLVVNGDQLVGHELVADVLEGHTMEEVATLGVIESDRTAEYGAVTLDDGYVTRITEQPLPDARGLLNAGVYVFAPSIFAAIEDAPRQHGELSLPDAIESLIGSGKPVRGVRTSGFWEDATYPWDLLSLSRKLLGRGHVGDAGDGDAVPSAEAASQPPSETTVAVDDGARIHEEAVIQGPVVVGPDCTIGPNAVVGPYVALGRNVSVEAGAGIRNSVIDQDARIGMNATLADTVTGQAAIIGPGTVIPGGRSDIPVGDRVYHDKQLGAVVADRAELAGGVSVATGSLIGPSARVRIGSHVRGQLDESAILDN